MTLLLNDFILITSILLLRETNSCLLVNTNPMMWKEPSPLSIIDASEAVGREEKGVIGNPIPFPAIKGAFITAARKYYKIISIISEINP